MAHREDHFQLPANTVYHGPSSVNMSEVQPVEIDWLWRGRLARGKLSLLAGDPGLGKSFVSLDLAARVSRGAAMPPSSENLQPADPASVVLLSAEDDAGDTLRPRLEAMDAALHRVTLLEGIRTGDAVRPFNLVRDLTHLMRLLEQMKDCRLVVIDPISAYLGSLDSHRNSEVRAVLAPLSTLAAKFGVAVLAVTHLNKGSGTAGMHRTMGSVAFTAAARAVFGVAADPQEPTRRLVAPLKHNLSGQLTGVAYRIAEGPRSPRVVWEDHPVGVDMNQLMAGSLTHPDGEARPPRNTKPSVELDSAKAFLREQLSQGPQPALELLDFGRAEGFNAITLRRAKASLGVRSAKDEGFGTNGQWLWVWPDNPATGPLFEAAATQAVQT